MTEGTKIWLISWLYHDRSGGGFVCAFDREDKARHFLGVLLKHGDQSKAYSIDPVEIDREYS